MLMSTQDVGKANRANVASELRRRASLDPVSIVRSCGLPIRNSSSIKIFETCLCPMFLIAILAIRKGSSVF